MKPMNKKSSDFHDYLLERLQDQKLAIAYLNQAIADPDQRVFLLALKKVCQAQGVDVKSFHRWNSLIAVVHALGITREIKPMKK